MTWKPISEAPAKTWLLVTWNTPPKLDPQVGPWDYRYCDYIPQQPAMVAILIDGDWRAYSEEGGRYGWIETPDKFMELPL